VSADDTSCGRCALCCKVYRIDEPTIAKPAGKWCQHARPGCAGGACSIYEHRPVNPCVEFECLWLQSQRRANPAERLAPELKPERSHVVLTVTKQQNLIVNCDVAFPDAWRRPPVMRVIQTFTKAGHEVYMVVGERRALIDAWKEE